MTSDIQGELAKLSPWDSDYNNIANRIKLQDKFGIFGWTPEEKILLNSIELIRLAKVVDQRK